MLVPGCWGGIPFREERTNSETGIYIFYFQHNIEIIMSNQYTFLVCGFLSPWQTHISLCLCCSLSPKASNPILGFTPSSMFSHKHLCHISHTGRIKFSLYRLTLFALTVHNTQDISYMYNFLSILSDSTGTLPIQITAS